MFMKIIKHWLTTYLLILSPVIAWCENEADSSFNVSLIIDQLVIEPGGSFSRIDGPKIFVEEKGAYSFEIEFVFLENLPEDEKEKRLTRVTMFQWIEGKTDPCGDERCWRKLFQISSRKEKIIKTVNFESPTHLLIGWWSLAKESKSRAGFGCNSTDSFKVNDNRDNSISLSLCPNSQIVKTNVKIKRKS